jgi:predicted ATPase
MSDLYNIEDKGEGAEILSFDDGEIYPCTYEETDSYQVTEIFINNREQILKRLLDKSE